MTDQSRSSTDPAEATGSGVDDGVGVQQVRVLIVDDHALFRQGIVAAVGAEVDIVGEVDDVDSAVAAIVRDRPDVVLLDVQLPSGSGRDVIERVAQQVPDIATQYLGLSVSDAADDVLGLVRAGARGYVVKRIDGPELVQAIAQVAAGNAVFSPRLAGFVLDAFTGAAGAGDQPSPSGGEGEVAEVDLLTPREREVMQHLARGYTYKEIGVELYISARTVETHASSVLRKLQLSNRHELTHWAARNRLV